MSFQGLINLREPSLTKSKLRVGNGLQVCVEKVGDASPVLAFEFELVLKDTFYVHSFRRNLISISYLDKICFSFTVGDRK